MCNQRGRALADAAVAEAEPEADAHAHAHAVSRTVYVRRQSSTRQTQAKLSDMRCGADIVVEVVQNMYIALVRGKPIITIADMVSIVMVLCLGALRCPICLWNSLFHAIHVGVLFYPGDTNGRCKRIHGMESTRVRAVGAHRPQPTAWGLDRWASEVTRKGGGARRQFHDKLSLNAIPP